jgi:fumarate hydratase class II
MTEYRTEKDHMGEVLVPKDALFGAQTQRAIENFPVSGIMFPRVFIRVLGLIKSAAAEVNAELHLLGQEISTAIIKAADEVAEGIWDEQFPLDIFQTGSGTSVNMNANEVIAGRAMQILGEVSGVEPVHPNNHVNFGQSSNDVIPSAIHVSAFIQAKETLLPSLRRLQGVLEERRTELDGIVKTGRTHLMDAMPIRLGQEVSGWAYQVAQGIERIESCFPRLAKLALGGTAVGTGINTHRDFGKKVAERIGQRTDIPFVETDNHFAAQATMDTATELSGHLKTTASSIFKIANDLRWMNSGPVAGLGEITLPALQPGSSIMPGKVNPVICEAAMMACAQVMGNDAVITICNQSGNFELNAMLPAIAHNLLQSINILGNSARLLADRVVYGFMVQRERTSALLEKNPILATPLNQIIGYDSTAQIVKRAYTEGRPLIDVASEMTNLPAETLRRLLDPVLMTYGGIIEDS